MRQTRSLAHERRYSSSESSCSGAAPASAALEACSFLACDFGDMFDDILVDIFDEVDDLPPLGICCPFDADCLPCVLLTVSFCGMDAPCSLTKQAPCPVDTCTSGHLSSTQFRQLVNVSMPQCVNTGLFPP